jgi:hypothetical protein
MNPQQARERVAETFPQPFNRAKFLEFSRNLLNKFLTSPRRRSGNTTDSQEIAAHHKGSVTPLNEVTRVNVNQDPF